MAFPSIRLCEFVATSSRDKLDDFTEVASRLNSKIFAAKEF